MSWHEVAQKDEPPEFYLVVDGAKYAVEVTRLMQKVNVGTKKPLPVGTIRDLLQNFVADEIESVARDNNCLRGAYLVSFSKPIDNFTNVNKMIKGELLTYIQSTQGLSKATGKVVYKSARQKCEIEKIHDGESKVIMGGPAIWKWKGEALADVRQLLDSSLGEKEYKLRNISSPKVLLLHDKYHFAGVEAYKSCPLSLTSLAPFHTVFFVESNGKGLVLYSKNPKWVDQY